MINSKRRKRDAGIALLEFALATTTILLLLFGIIDVGRALFAYDWVSDAARQATRFAMVRGSSCSGLSGGCPADGDDVTAYVRSIATGIDTSPDKLTVTTHCFAPDGSDQDPPYPCAPKGYVRVTVQYQFSFLSPLAARSWTMSSASERTVQN